MVLIAILDDSREGAQAMERLLKRYAAEKGVPCLVHKYDSSVELIRSRTVYDVVFLNLRVGDMSGLDAAHFLQVVNKNVKLIFAAHMAHSAICGHEAGAVDFVAEPVSQPVIDRVMDKVLAAMDGNKNERYALKTADCVIWLPADSIYYVEAVKRSLVYHTAQGDHRTRGSFKQARERLGEQSFIQCDRSCLVNMRHVQSLHDDYLMVKGVNIHIARSYHREVRQTILGYLGRSG